MSLTHVVTARNGLTDYIVDQLDSGNLVIMTSGDVDVATLPLSASAFGASAGGTATAAAITDDSNAAGGTAALFKMETSGNSEIFRGTVGIAGADLNLSSLDVGVGDTVSVTSFTYSSSV